MTEEQDKPIQDNLAKAKALCEQVGEMLQREDADLSQIAEDLRQVIEALPDPQTTESRGIQDKTAELWRELVVKVEDLPQAEAYLREGANRFDSHEAGITFQRMRARVQSALATQKALKLPAERSWPAWLEGPEGKTRLSELLSTLDALLEEKAWPPLVEQAHHQHELLCKEMLPPYLNQIAEGAHQMAQERDFARAQQRINAALNFVPQTHLSHLPDTVDRRAMRELEQAIEARQQAEVAIWTRLVRMTGQETTIQAAFQDFQPDLPDHPDVWVGDLESLITDLTQAAETEAVLDPVSAGTDIFIDPSKWEKMVRSEITIQEEMPAFLVSSDPQLVSKLQAHLAELEHRIQRAPQEIIAALESDLEHEHPEEQIAGTSKLVTHYWQVIWWLEQGIFKEPDHVESGRAAIEEARDSLQALAAYAGDLFAGMKHKDDLAVVADTLSALRELNQDLARFPEKVEADLPEMDLPLPPEPLETWHNTLLSWMDISPKGPAEEAAPGGLEQLEWIVEDVSRILEDIKRVKEEVWPALELSSWEADSTPGKAEVEGELILNLIAALEAINEQVADLPSLEAAALLEKRLEESGYLQQHHEVWLLLSYHAVLLTSVQRLRQAFEEGINTQITEILDDLESAPERLREDILTRVITPELGELAYYSIKTYATERAETAQNEARSEVLALWDAIRQATQPWASEGDEPVELPQESTDLWRQLHQEANWEYRKAWALNKRLEIGAGIGFVILLAIIAFVVLPGLGRFRDGPQPTLVGALPTAEATSQPAVAAATEPIETTTPLPSPTERDLGATSTAQAEATQEAVLALAGTRTAQATVCLDEAAYDFTILEGAELNPPRGTYYVTGTTPYPVTIAWQLRNSGDCAWEQLAIETQSDGLEVDYELSRAGNGALISAEEPVEVEEVITVVLRFGVQEVSNLSGEAWTLVANGIPLAGSPPLTFDAQDWIISVTPPPSRP